MNHPISPTVFSPSPPRFYTQRQTHCQSSSSCSCGDDTDASDDTGSRVTCSACRRDFERPSMYCQHSDGARLYTEEEGEEAATLE